MQAMSDPNSAVTNLIGFLVCTLRDMHAHTHTHTHTRMHARTHTHTHTQALDWCIESTGLLSEHDLLSVSLVNTDPEYIKHEFDQFLTECPPPSEDNLQQLTDLTDSIENVWTKENAVFAYNRVLEIKERFQYYYKILEEQIVEKKELERKEEESRRELMKKSRKVVRAVDSLLTTVSGEGEGNDVFLESQEMSVEMGHVPPDLDGLPAVKSVDDRPHPEKTESQLSLYYDADIDKALKLLESTAQRASFEGAVDIGECNEMHAQGRSDDLHKPCTPSRCY